MQIHKTVFISYRHTNSPIAQAIRLGLMRHGFDVFLDFDSINSGSFGHVILNQIAARAHFLILLTPSALEICVNPNDWLRKEIEEAMKLKRNIIPLFFEEFEFKNYSQYLKGDLLPTLSEYNGMKIHWDMFDQTIEKLCTRFLNIPNELVIHPVPPSENEIVEEAQEEADKQDSPTPEQLKAQEYFEKGTIKYNKSDYAEAIEDYTSAILFDDDFAKAYYSRGLAYLHLKYYEKGIADFDKVISIISEFEYAYCNRGFAYMRLKKYEHAIIDFNKAIELNDKYLTPYVQRGNVYGLLKDYKRSLSDYEQALEIDPDDEVIKNMIYIIQAELEQK